MTKRMTEPAQLYWKDLDVLEEARSQLVDFLEAVKQRFDDDRDQRWSQETTNESESLEGWNDGSGGKWTLFLKGSPSRFYVTISDPRQARKDPGTYDLVVWIGKEKLRQLAKVEGLLPELTSLAQDEGVRWDWEDREKLSVVHVPVRPDSAEDTASELLEETLRVLRILSRFDTIIAERSVAQ